MTLTNEELNTLYTKGFFLAQDNKIVVCTAATLQSLGIDIVSPEEDTTNNDL